MFIGFGAPILEFKEDKEKRQPDGNGGAGFHQYQNKTGSIVVLYCN